MKIKRIIPVLILTLIIAGSCSKYEDYDKDFDYTTVYFSYQKPIRTIVARDEMTFQIGVQMGGVRENTIDRTVKFVIDTSLFSRVTGANKYKLLPKLYYAFSDTQKMVIHSGDLTGRIDVTLNKALFTGDTMAYRQTYALPIRIVSASQIDSVLRNADINVGMDYTIIVVKYMSPYGGTYLTKGAEYKLGTLGDTIARTLYSINNWATDVKTTSTLGLNTILTNKISAGTTGGLRITVKSDDQVDLSYVGSAVTAFSGNGRYDRPNKSFYLKYNFAKSGSNYTIADTLILRQDPELDMHVQLW